MIFKRKSSARPDSWERVRHFEYMLPVPLDEALRLIRTPTDYYKDAWLQAATIHVEPEHDGLARMHFLFGKQTLFEGYLKALADDTTLVSGKAPAHIQTPPPPPQLTPEQEAELNAKIYGYPVILLFGVICSVVTGNAMLGLDAIIALVVMFIGVFAFSVYEGRQRWRTGLRERDDLLIALEKRLGIEQEFEK
jgi:hypothetical protein